MPYNYLIICNSAAARLLSRHFTSHGVEEGGPAAHRLASEDAALRALAPLWPKLASSLSAPPLSEQSNAGMNLRKHVVTIGDQVIVAARVGELVVILAGSDDTEEFHLSEGLDAVASVLTASLDPRRQPSSSQLSVAAVTEPALMHPETFGKVCVAIDDLMPDGVLETADLDTVMRMSKLKSFV